MANKTSKTTTPKKKSTAAPKRASSTAPKRYASSRPLFSTATITTFVTFLLVVAATIYISQKKETDAANATPTAESANVFTSADGTPTSIKIEPANGEAVQIDRNSENVWELTLPTKTEANQGMAEAAATQVAAIDVVTAEIKGDAADFGLDIPAYVITITFDGGQTHKLEVGDSAVTNNGYYVRLDKSKIMLVSLSAIDSLTQLAVFPPYLNTPTPTALPPSETPVPVLDTPTTSPAEVTVTPTP